MKQKHFEKQDSYFFRFIAIMLVIIAHYSDYIYAISKNRIWNLLNKTGRYGVALFFLVSGYGLVHSIKGKPLDYHFFLRRLKSTYLPFLVIQLLALIYIGIPHSPMSAKDWIYYFIGIDYWYIFVILVLYGCFYIAMKYFTKNQELVLFLFVSVFNTILALFGCNEWWYLTNYVFCLGVYFALHEQNQKINRLLLTSLLFFGFITSSILYAKIEETFVHDLFKIMATVCFAGFAWYIYAILPFHIRIKPLNYIGTCSLYIYILHVQTLSLMRKHNISSYGIIILSVFAVILLSALVEKIMSKLIKS